MPNAQQEIIQALSPFRGTIVTMHVSTEGEPQHFGKVLAEIPSAAGWTGEATNALFAGQVPEGLILHSDGAGTLAANALAAQLNKRGIRVANTGKPNDKTRGNGVSIGVGSLPIR